MMADAPVTDDVLKFQLKPIADADYLPKVFDAAEKSRLAAIFPSAVCDYAPCQSKRRCASSTGATRPLR